MPCSCRCQRARWYSPCGRFFSVPAANRAGRGYDGGASCRIGFGQARVAAQQEQVFRVAVLAAWVKLKEPVMTAASGEPASITITLLWAAACSPSSHTGPPVPPARPPGWWRRAGADPGRRSPARRGRAAFASTGPGDVLVGEAVGLHQHLAFGLACLRTRLAASSPGVNRRPGRCARARAAGVAGAGQDAQGSRQDGTQAARVTRFFPARPRRSRGVVDGGVEAQIPPMSRAMFCAASASPTGTRR